MAHDVFICHASRDKTVADAVCSVLESHGVRCWIAPRDILAGTSYAEGIVEAINEARVMVLVFSATANASQQVEREIERAVHRNLPLIPFRIEDVVPERALEYFLSTPHWLDAYTPPLEQHLATLATQVAALLGRPTREVTALAAGAARQGAAPAAQAPPARKGQNSLVLVAGAVVAVSVLVLAAVIFFKPFQGGQPGAALAAPATSASAPAAAATTPSAPPAPAAATPAEASATPAAATAPAAAVTCRVADPTPTPLNIRAAPGGAITGAIDNGQQVRVTDHLQVSGKGWALIDPVSGSPKAGWVFASYLDCPGG